MPIRNYSILKGKASTRALDYVRGNFVQRAAMEIAPFQQLADRIRTTLLSSDGTIAHQARRQGDSMWGWCSARQETWTNAVRASTGSSHEAVFFSPQTMDLILSLSKDESGRSTPASAIARPPRERAPV